MEPGPQVRAWVEELGQRNEGGVVDLVLAIHRATHRARALRYEPGETWIGVTADDLLTGGAGVCQDYAHLAVSACRVLGIPARYVSGYFFAHDDRTGEVSGDTASVQTHAWFEAAIPGGGWLALDPTNAVQVGERHVTIGRGRDYDDVPPIRGVYAGVANARVDAGVEMRRMTEVVRRTRFGEAVSTRRHAGRMLLSGIELRYALTAALLRAGTPLTVPELVRSLERDGFACCGRTSKAVSDALRWEIGRGRVVRLRRGLYVVGHMPKQTRSRISRRVADLRMEAGMRS